MFSLSSLSDLVGRFDCSAVFMLYQG